MTFPASQASGVDTPCQFQDARSSILLCNPDVKWISLNILQSFQLAESMNIQPKLHSAAKLDILLALTLEFAGERNCYHTTQRIGGIPLKQCSKMDGDNILQAAIRRGSIEFTKNLGSMQGRNLFSSSASWHLSVTGSMPFADMYIRPWAKCWLTILSHLSTKFVNQLECCALLQIEVKRQKVSWWHNLCKLSCDRKN